MLNHQPVSIYIYNYIYIYTWGIYWMGLGWSQHPSSVVVTSCLADVSFNNAPPVCCKFDVQRVQDFRNLPERKRLWSLQEDGPAPYCLFSETQASKVCCSGAASARRKAHGSSPPLPRLKAWENIMIYSYTLWQTFTVCELEITILNG